MTEQNWHEKYLKEREAKRAFADRVIDLAEALEELLDRQKYVNDTYDSLPKAEREIDRKLIDKCRKVLDNK